MQLLAVMLVISAVRMVTTMSNTLFHVLFVDSFIMVVASLPALPFRESASLRSNGYAMWG